jgi:hypothetical protein
MNDFNKNKTILSQEKINDLLEQLALNNGRAKPKRFVSLREHLQLRKILKLNKKCPERCPARIIEQQAKARELRLNKFLYPEQFN